MNELWDIKGHFIYSCSKIHLLNALYPFRLSFIHAFNMLFIPCFHLILLLHAPLCVGRLMAASSQPEVLHHFRFNTKQPHLSEWVYPIESSSLFHSSLVQREPWNNAQAFNGRISWWYWCPLPSIFWYMMIGMTTSFYKI